MNRPVIQPGTRCLVTGGAGFIGSNIVDRRLAGGAAVRVLDDLSTGRLENLPLDADGFELVEGSITEPSTCARACAGIDLVFHQAALPSVERSVLEPTATHAVDATGTLNVLWAAKEAGVGRLVYAGSSSAYGDTPELPKHEGMATSPKSPYAAAKLAGEMYCRVFSEVYGFETVVLRYFNIYGPRQDPTSQYSAVIPIFLAAAMAGGEVRINGDGEQTRDFTYVDNAVDANVLAATAPVSAASGRVFNVGCGERTSINTLWAEIRDIVGTGAEAVYGPARAGDVRDSLADLTQIRRELGFHSAVALPDGLRRTCAWFGQRQQRVST
jgi:nucleoside-diphosphate-sugar epimerase